MLWVVVSGHWPYDRPHDQTYDWPQDRPQDWPQNCPHGWSKLSLLILKFTYLQTLLDAAVDFQYPLAGTSKEAEQKVRDVWEKEDYARYGEIVQDIVILWGDPSIQKCIEQKAKIQVSPFKLTPHVDISPAPRLSSVFLEKSYCYWSSGFLAHRRRCSESAQSNHRGCHRWLHGSFKNPRCLMDVPPS